ncbi:MAG: hypothetical protein IT357_14530 [Gemmatimonadaceae bacterium]|nr:hypothetical protein [Gemmatimonadaceae bacterium]
MLEYALVIVGLAAAVGVVGFLQWERADFAKAQVLGALGRVHATKIELSADWFDHDEGTMTYDVEYTTPDGRRHSNRCKVATGPAAGTGVFWERPLKGAE